MMRRDKEVEKDMEREKTEKDKEEESENWEQSLDLSPRDCNG